MEIVTILLNDTWSNDKESLKLALEYLHQFDQRKHGIILSELSSETTEEDEAYFRCVRLPETTPIFFYWVGAKWHNAMKAMILHALPCGESTEDLVDAIDHHENRRPS